jgi:phosphatidylglycerophosphate synthase
VSVFALLTGCLAGVAYALTRLSPGYFFLGGLLAAVSALADGLDGVMARLHGRTSTLGDFLDHFFDRLVEVAILGGLALSPHATTTLGLAVLVGVLLTSYLGTQIQASFGARHYTGLGKAELFVGLVLASAVLGVTPNASIPFLGREVSLVDALFAVVGLSTVHALVHRLRLAMRLASGETPKKG